MDDERLLSEALRAQAAGGVSTPRPAPRHPEPPNAMTSGTAGAPDTRSRRFRPLGRRRGEATPTTTAGAGLRADVPAPRTGGVTGPPGGYPGPPRPPYAGPRPGPTSGPLPAHGPYPPARPVPPRTEVPADGPGTWGAGTVAWWGAVSLLGGGAVGAAIGTLSLLLPA